MAAGDIPYDTLVSSLDATGRRAPEKKEDKDRARTSARRGPHCAVAGTATAVSNRVFPPASQLVRFARQHRYRRDELLEMIGPLL